MGNIHAYGWRSFLTTHFYVQHSNMHMHKRFEGRIYLRYGVYIATGAENVSGMHWGYTFGVALPRFFFRFFSVLDDLLLCIYDGKGLMAWWMGCGNGEGGDDTR